ncbi:MAG: hypothetical protein RLZZ453_376 [Chlamydiota bacterium]|jgi:FMN phosphatase YigB (HAD superfamily)
MREGGLQVKSEKESFALLCRLNERSLSGGAALSEFVELLGGAPSVLQRGMDALYALDEVPFPLDPLEGVIDTLKILKKEHRLAVVTMGRPALQLQKLKKAGIDSGFFSKIIVSEEDKKGILYEELIQQESVLKKDVLVCGDRIARDLSPAKRVGCRTVLMRWGRGLNAQLPHPDVDYAISSIRELKSIIG